MRVVADSHAVYWYVVSPDRLSERALDTLTAAETTDGIAVSAVTMPDLWMAATRKRGVRALPRSGYDLLRAALLDPSTALDVTALDATAWEHFEALPPCIADPMDGLIVATALALGLPLVTRDGRISEAGSSTSSGSPPAGRPAVRGHAGRPGVTAGSPARPATGLAQTLAQRLARA